MEKKYIEKLLAEWYAAQRTIIFARTDADIEKLDRLREEWEQHLGLGSTE
jgi:hypothetical protein